ncbi:MAG: Ribose ABC transport system, ATP-binding protein RbsA [uncultured Thermomicrobiales bacterium]|uniref:Ribose ABC transport system, ATP-binding protein RbsA n=1 Tax=uncultured Thermomicrobiales bacterium TaxID=1645740 RepID=A0A6J4UTW1_9BACT|nr:MAG: Ribose ABC transport system, ATP-binding protein RbsA [uncultured Thermomicrobiales bacterium]
MTHLDADPPLLEMDGVVKTFPGVLALDEASLRVGRGEVHAVVGQNGAGKSTLMKILNGAYRRDGGSVTFDGRPVDFGSTQEAQLAGVSTIFQEINLVPYRSVAENVFMGREPRRFGLINWSRMNREAWEILSRMGVSVDPRRPLGELNIALQQMVAIARAVSFDTKLVIMDEPTSSLDDREVETLFGVIRELKGRGVSVVFITHRLDELYAVCDRVTIMRDGKTVAAREMGEVGKLELVALMLGKEVGEVRRSGATGFGRRTAQADGLPVVELHDAALAPRLHDADLAVRPGEIVGLAGLLGSGRSEVARIVFGADAPEGGEMEVNGKPAKLRSPRDAIREGFGFLAEDRKADGIVPYMSVRENLTLAALPTLAKNGVVDRKRQDEIVDRFISRLGIKTAGPEQTIRELSGGNQQKVLLARWLCLNPKLLLLDEPTRGIDVGAKAEIQGLIDELADAGLGVLMISSEIEEITEGSDRVVVLRDGKTVAEFGRDEISQDAVMTAMAHGEGERVGIAAHAGGGPIADPATVTAEGR